LLVAVQIEYRGKNRWNLSWVFFYRYGLCHWNLNLINDIFQTFWQQFLNPNQEFFEIITFLCARYADIRNDSYERLTCELMTDCWVLDKTDLLWFLNR
jgi:hypothetical protein